MRIISKEGRKMALKFGLDDLGEGLSFLTEEEDFIQVGGWRYGSGRRLPAHIHNFLRRDAERTQEFVYVVKGCVRAFVYDEEEGLLEEIVLNPGEGLILFAGGHGYEVARDDTVVLEVKNGPYAGAEMDRRRLKEGQ
jgi:hypothetical protein